MIIFNQKNCISKDEVYNLDGDGGKTTILSPGIYYIHLNNEK